MDIETKRQSLYAALLRYSPEAGSLRDRALDRIIMAALLGSSEENPLQAREIQQNIKFAHDSPEIRTEVVKQTLNRLSLQKKVTRSKHNVFYLTTEGCADLEEAAESVAKLFEPVLQRMLADTASLCSSELGVVVCRGFISQCFARFGQKIAKVITGELDRDELVDTINVNSAFDAAIRNLSLSTEAVESLKARCIRFLRSTEPEDEELKFRLTQGYYFAQLLGLDSAQFNPISKEAFQGAIFFIDTNVLLSRLLTSPTTALFDEVIRIAARLGIELRVTRATIDETRWVGRSRLEDIKDIIEKVPKELAEKSTDDILLAFLREKKDQPTLKPEDFLERFDKIPELIETLGIFLDDRDVSEIIGNKDISREAQIIQRAAEATRGYGKPEPVAAHDVCHYFLVLAERSKGKRAWFLSRDRTLYHAAALLSEGGLFFCFPLVAFLQSISPFLETNKEENSLVNLFSTVLEHDVPGFPREKLFDLAELKLIGEFHEDVFSTPTDQIVLAFDYIKSNVLDGKQYEKSDHPKVALALKKFLSSTADEKQRELRAEAQRQKKLAEDERTKRELAEGQTREVNEELIGLQIKSEEAEKRELALTKSQVKLRACVMLLGALVAVGLWLFDSEIGKSLGTDSALSIAAIRLFGSLILIGSAIPTAFLLESGYRIGALTVVVALALGGLDFLGIDKVSEWSGYLAIAAPIALFLVILFQGRAKT